jgi:cytidylate kinase
VRLITLSASYGAGGSVIGPLLAEQLGVPFLDRAVSAALEDELGQSREAASTREDVTRSLWRRIFDGFAFVAPEGLGELPPPRIEDPDTQLREEAEKRLHSFAEGGSGVVLGWAGTVVLPQAFRVRLDGPIERRVVQGMRIEGMDEAATRQRLIRSDEIRKVYLKRLYRTDWRNPDLYHLWIDSTVVAPETVVELISTAATAFWARTGS